MLYSRADRERIIASRMKMWLDYKGNVLQCLPNPMRDRIGVAGEIWFAEKYGLEVNEQKERRSDGGTDFKTHVGTFDIKASESCGLLLVQENPKNPPKFYVLAEYSRKTDDAVGVGWCTSAWFFQNKRVKKFKNVCWIVGRELLRPIPDTLDGYVE